MRNARNACRSPLTRAVGLVRSFAAAHGHGCDGGRSLRAAGEEHPRRCASDPGAHRERDARAGGAAACSGRRHSAGRPRRAPARGAVALRRLRPRLRGAAGRRARRRRARARRLRGAAARRAARAALQPNLLPPRRQGRHRGGRRHPAAPYRAGAGHAAPHPRRCGPAAAASRGCGGLGTRHPARCHRHRARHRRRRAAGAEPVQRAARHAAQHGGGEPGAPPRGDAQDGDDAGGHGVRVLHRRVLPQRAGAGCCAAGGVRRRGGVAAAAQRQGGLGRRRPLARRAAAVARRRQRRRQGCVAPRGAGRR